MRLLLLALTLTISSCVNNKIVENAPYSVEAPTSGKNHAVIKIITENGGGCTAFVISNRKAITAGHCVEVSESLIKNNKEDAILGARIFIETLLKEMNSVDCNYIDNMPKIQCFAIKKTMSRDIQNAKRYIEKLTKNQPDTFKVFNSKGKEIKIKVTALDSELGFRDFAVLHGDFSEFEKLPIATNFNTLPGELLRTCGYANLKTPAVCTNFIALGNSSFAYKGNGYLVKGMSGGPVVNSLGEVVGINVAVAREEVLVTPTIGILDVILKEEE